MINPIKDKEKCCACGACINVCHHKAITMGEDEHGFIIPIVNTSKCTSCNLCDKVCPMNAPILNEPIITYAAAWKNQNIIKSASGGIFAALATHIIQQKGVIFGCVLENIKGTPTPIIRSAHNLKDLQSMLGSKYVQASTLNTYTEVKELLQKDIQVLYSGTPCQIAGLKSFLRKEYSNLITIDLICHGTPSAKLFQSYLTYIEKKEKISIKNFIFRDKSKGWGSFYYKYYFLTPKQQLKCKVKKYTNSIYYRLFLASAIYRDSCYYCPFANVKRVSDITIGDFWGIEKEYPELNTINGGIFNFAKGVSCVLINTEKGKLFWDNTKSTIISVPTDINKISKYNHQLTSPSPEYPLRQIYLDSFKTGGYPHLVNTFYKKEWKTIIRSYLLGWISLNIKSIIKSIIK